MFQILVTIFKRKIILFGSIFCSVWSTLTVKSNMYQQFRVVIGKYPKMFKKIIL